MANVISYNGKILADKNGHVFKYGGNSGTIDINTNGIHDVNGFANANVNVSGGVTPSGTLNIINNGTYDVTNYASVDVNISPQIPEYVDLS